MANGQPDAVINASVKPGKRRKQKPGQRAPEPAYIFTNPQAPTDTIAPPTFTAPGTPPPFDQNQFNDLLSHYISGFGDLTNAYLQKQGKGLTDLPSFQEMYNSYRQIGEQETERQTASLNEAFGSQGARYGSDLLRGQGQLRRELTNDLQNQAGQFKLQLYDRQSRDYIPFLNAETNMRSNALSYLMNNYLRQTSPPPLLNEASTYAGGFGPPNTVVI